MVLKTKTFVRTPLAGPPRPKQQIAASRKVGTACGDRKAVAETARQRWSDPKSPRGNDQPKIGNVYAGEIGRPEETDLAIGIG